MPGISGERELRLGENHVNHQLMKHPHHKGVADGGYKPAKGQPPRGAGG
jgi:hypothetical protein